MGCNKLDKFRALRAEIYITQWYSITDEINSWIQLYAWPPSLVSVVLWLLYQPPDRAARFDDLSTHSAVPLHLKMIHSGCLHFPVFLTSLSLLYTHPLGAKTDRV